MSRRVHARHAADGYTPIQPCWLLAYERPGSRRQITFRRRTGRLDLQWRNDGTSLQWRNDGTSQELVPPCRIDEIDRRANRSLLTEENGAGGWAAVRNFLARR
jgi:hypothetical protein